LGQSVNESVEFTNKGLDVLINPRLSIVNTDNTPAPAWVSLFSSAELGDMAIGERKTVQLAVAPPTTQSEGNYSFKLKVESDNLADFSVPVHAAVTQSGVGNVFFHAADIYTATLNENNQPIPGLQNATVKLQNEQVLTETFSASTDVNGELLFEGIPAGRYSFRASAFDHESVSGRVWIKPGVTATEEVFLVNNLITVEWAVNEITLEDRYEIKLNATFETHVPVAVVMFDPLSINLPVMKEGDIFHGELTLTNHGLIRADNVVTSMPSGNHLASFEFLSQVPDTLEAGDVFVLPYRVQALQDFDPAEDGSASGGGCGGFNAQAKANYDSKCANGAVVPGGTSANWNSNWGGGGGSGSSCGTGGGGGGSQDYYYSGGGGGGGSSYTPVSKPIGGGSDAACAAPPLCPTCGGGAAGSNGSNGP